MVSPDLLNGRGNYGYARYEHYNSQQVEYFLELF